MRKSNKLLTKILIGILSAVLCIGATACGAGDDIDRSENTISIRAMKAGYGVTYLTKFKEKFETLYADQGYKVQILTPSSDMQSTIAIQEMYSKDDWADIYFSGGLSVSGGVTGDYGQVFADMTELVWNKPAIDFNGNEESTLIKDKLNTSVNETVYSLDGKVYCMPFGVSLGGMIVNFAKLKAYGYTELPRTSNELFEMFETIYNNTLDRSNSMSRVYPLTFLGEQNGYHMHMQLVWLAQYMGVDGFDRFMSFTDENGNWRLEDGYQAYDDPAIRILLEKLYEMYDVMYIAPGSLRNDLSAAHAMIMSDTSGAVFMAEGDWAYNEMVVDNTEKMDNIAFINVPILSELGVKLFGAGTSYNYSDDKCEEILSWAIKQIDEGKSVDQIKTESENKDYNIKDAEIERLLEARGVYCDRSISSAGITICEKSQNKDIAALFIRMFCSDDGSILYNQESNGYTAYTQNFSAMKSNQFSQSYIKIRQNEKAHGVYLTFKELRNRIAIANSLLPKDYYLAEVIIAQSVTAYNPNTGSLKPEGKNIYKTAAANRFQEEVQYAADKWSFWTKYISVN